MLQKRLERYDTALYLRLSKEDGDVASGSKNESNSIAIIYSQDRNSGSYLSVRTTVFRVRISIVRRFRP